MSSEQPIEPVAPGAPQPPEPKSSSRKWLGLFVIGGVVASLAGILVNRFVVNPPLSPDDPPEKTYQKIFDAYGGHEALDRWKCGVVKYESTDDLPGQPHSEARTTQAFWTPGRMRSNQRKAYAGQIEEAEMGRNGRRTWLKVNNDPVQTRDLPNLEQSEHSSFIVFYHPYYILQAKERLRAKGIEERPDGGRDLVVTIDREGRDVVEVRIDTRTKLLRGYHAQMPLTVGGERVEGRCDFSDYQKTDGGMVPTRITFHHGDRRVREYRFLSVEFRVGFGPDEFAPPKEHQ